MKMKMQKEKKIRKQIHTNKCKNFTLIIFRCYPRHFADETKKNCFQCTGCEFLLQYVTNISCVNRREWGWLFPQFSAGYALSSFIFPVIRYDCQFIRLRNIRRLVGFYCKCSANAYFHSN